MIKTTIKILLSFYFAILFPCFLQNQAEASAEIQEYIIERLNNIRSDPLSYAEGLGYDRQMLLETLPFFNEVIEKNVELFTIDEFLNLKAGSLNSPDTLEADLPEPDLEVLPESDYACTGETKATVLFSNFMGIETAVQIVINNLFKKELDPDFEGQRYILSSDFNLAGASLTGGTTWDQTGMKNSYFITICFASSLLKLEVQVLNMINQVRAYPLKINDYIFFNLGSLVTENTDAIYAFFKKYPPLFLNSTLQTYGTVFNNADEDYLGQALFYGYNGIEVNKSSIVEIIPKTDSNSLAALVFSSLISNELKTYPEKKIIFNPDFNDAGLSYISINDDLYDYTGLSITAGERISEDSVYSRIYGIVYNDIDENDVYAPGEGAAKETVIIYNKETSEKIETIITDNAGYFSVNLLNQKEYIIQSITEIGTDEIITEKNIYLDADQFFILKLMPIESENLNMQTEVE